MNTPRPPLRINIGYLLNQPKGTHRDIPIDLPGFQLLEEYAPDRLTGMVRISRTSEGLLVQGDFRMHITQNCGRCVAEMQQELHTEFTELYAFAGPGPFEDSDEDTPELVVPEDGYIDLEPLLREYLLLEIPISPLCRPDCRGLCPECGANLNETTCEHAQNLPSSAPPSPR